MSINVILAFMIIVSFLIALPLHEFAHAQVASWLGDPTPRSDGRQTLSLRMHIDPLGTLLCIILAFLPVAAGPIGLGWGRPVKIDPWKLRGGRNGGPIMVAISGILFSLFVGLLAAVAARFLVPLAVGVTGPGSFVATNPVLLRLPQFFTVFACVNICLAIFNLLPIYPLDGYEILYMLLPTRQALGFARSGPYGPFIILILFFLLPFLGQFSGLGFLPIFHIPYYILLGSFYLVSLVMGFPVDLTTAVYMF